MNKTISALVLLLSPLFSVGASAESIRIDHNPVTTYLSGNAINGDVSYIYYQNGEVIGEQASPPFEIDVPNAMGSTFCLATKVLENNVTLLSAKDVACGTIPDSRPATPTINIQLIWNVSS